MPTTSQVGASMSPTSQADAVMPPESQAAAGVLQVRRGVRTDLNALVELERNFPGDRLKRPALARLLNRESTEVWVAELKGEIVGDAVVLFRSGFASARLYSLVVGPQSRGRGVAKALLARAEEGALERGAVTMRLEVRPDNAAALALYQGLGYEVMGSTDAYYEDGSTALRLSKRFVAGATHMLGVPYYPQSLDFTCGPAALMMAMRFHGYPQALERELELELWRESTIIFMMAGHGGCSAHGLAVAALRRGFRATVVTADDDVPFLDGVRSADKKEVIGIAHATFQREMKELGGSVKILDFRDADVVRAIDEGAVPLLLVSGYRLYAEKVPHWVAVTGYDAEHLYVHDPNIPEGSGRADSVHLALPRAGFDQVSRYGKRRHRAMVLVERWGRVKKRRSPSSG